MTDAGPRHTRAGTATLEPTAPDVALLFEGGLVVMLVPLIAWWLDISLWEALVADIALVVFYVVFAFVYNLAYDHIFPIPEGKAKPADGSAGR